MKKRIAHLLFVSGPLKGTPAFVPEEGCRLGRDRRCMLSIDDESLSRDHCRFFFRAGKLWVADLGSANGTLLNGSPVQTAALAVGDHITAGKSRLRVRNTSLMTVDGLRSRLAAEAAEAPPPSRWSRIVPVLHAAAWALVIVWLAFLAFSLMLPPPDPPARAPAGPAPDNGAGGPAPETAPPAQQAALP
jgi:pSer/pThr/pTyr-binding forkhead associated (FHA) protein